MRYWEDDVPRGPKSDTHIRDNGLAFYHRIRLEERMERRLSAILAADIVGYSAQMERDESGTFDRVTQRRKEIFEPEIARHHGRIFKLMGDGILAEFASVVQAVECAVVLQSALEERNRAVPEEQAIRARIGINLGEVIVDGDDRYGEGVNIAARLEQLADHGGICVSDKVAREVEKKLAFGFEPMGAQRVKNIAEPVMAYRVSPTRVGRPRASVKWPRRWDWTGSMLALAGAILVAVLMWLQPPIRHEGPPTLAVLPFANLSGDPAQDYLAPAIAEDIMMMLSTSPLVQVVSRSSSFSAASSADAMAMASRLSVDYVLEGSLRRDGDVFHISAQLVDAQSGRSLWSERLEQQGSKIVAMQEAVARKIYATLAATTGKLAAFEESLTWAKAAPSLEEYDYHLRGAAEYLKFSASSKSAAERIWSEGLAKFPDSTLLRLELAAVYNDYAQEGPSSDPWKDIQTAWRLLQEADSKPDKSRIEQWLTHQLKAQLLPLVHGDFEGSVYEAEAAHALAPHDPLTNLSMSYVMANAGRGEKAVEWAEYAVQNAVLVPSWYRDRLAWAYWSDGRPQDAIREYEQTDYFCVPCKVSTLMRVNRVEEAKALMADDIARRPGWALEDERLWPSGHHSMMVEHLMDPYLDDLRAAGQR
jgi:class 3 adenylate cyclase/TolB-like protein